MVRLIRDIEAQGVVKACLIGPVCGNFTALNTVAAALGA
jgi:hypothetical protein